MLIQHLLWNVPQMIVLLVAKIEDHLPVSDLDLLHLVEALVKTVEKQLHDLATTVAVLHLVVNVITNRRLVTPFDPLPLKGGINYLNKARREQVDGRKATLWYMLRWNI